MRKVRTIIALAFAAGTLLVGAAVPAHGAPAATASTPIHFGPWETLEWCQYYGESLTSSPQFDYYNCVYEWHSGDPRGYYHLYVW